MDHNKKPCESGGQPTEKVPAMQAAENPKKEKAAGTSRWVDGWGPAKYQPSFCARTSTSKDWNFKM